MNKIIFLHFTPLLPRLKSAYMIPELINAGYEVAYWDISSIIRPGLIMHDEIKEDFVKRITKLETLKPMVLEENSKSCLFVVPFKNILKTKPVLEFLKKYNFKIAHYDIYLNSINRINISISNFPNIIRTSTLLELIKNFKSVVFNNFKKKDLFDFTIASFGERTHAINNPNYEIYRSIDCKPSIINGDYILFVDNFYPYHPEYECPNKLRNRKAKLYYPSMRKFFDFLENKYKMPVVVAKHPSANYTNSEFGNRKIVGGETAILVKYAKLAIMHMSFANIFAVLAGVPIVFIKTKHMKYVDGIFSIYRIENMANLLNKKVYDIDMDNFNNISAEEINDDIRKNFLYHYITTLNNQELSNQEIILNVYNEIFSSYN